MTNRERVLAAVGHRSPDKVPYDIRFTQTARATMAAHYGDPEFESRLGNCFTWLRPHLPDARFVEVAPDIWADEFGVRWDRRVDTDIGVVCNRLVTSENVRIFAFPDPDDPARYGSFDQAIGPNGDTAVLVSLGFSLFERAWTLAGMEAVLMAMVCDKPFANALLDRIVEFNLAIIENACTKNVDIFRFGDDWGHQRGVLMGPSLWREFIKPRFRRMCELVKSKGKLVMLHCCGKVDELFPDLIECGLDIFNPFQPEVMDVFEIKKQYGSELTFYGGISIQRTLPFGTVAEVRDEVRRLIDVVGADGGYIASPSHDIPGDARPENVAAMIEVLQNQ
ncbi:MAG TPA: uroporphyrinogen decarboxylase family protein [Sedimentisphaerales bacterium]|nr:uroporphyrinogen decarboxylase family protein [Sedimentisphaerales bacterium]